MDRHRPVGDKEGKYSNGGKCQKYKHENKTKTNTYSKKKTTMVTNNNLISFILNTQWELLFQLYRSEFLWPSIHMLKSWPQVLKGRWCPQEAIWSWQQGTHTGDSIEQSSSFYRVHCHKIHEAEGPSADTEWYLHLWHLSLQNSEIKSWSLKSTESIAC